MTGLPPISAVVGGHLAAYDALYKQADVNGTGKIQAAAAAVFLKRSGLKEPVLHKIWECCDRLGRGYLDKQAMVVALKLVALAQIGKDVDMAHISLPAPIPSMSASLPRTASPPVVVDNLWAVTPDEKTRYDTIFDGLAPTDNKLSGEKVRPVFLNSKLNVETLSKIWDLSDIDADGLLDRDEFAVAMHLVFKALEKEPTPQTLPANLMPPSKRKKPTVLPGAVGVLPVGVTLKPLNSTAPTVGAALLGTEMLRPASPAGSTWVVSSVEKSQADVVFKQIDTDVDGFVNGEEVRPILIQSGVPQPELAQIWNLCDIKQTGKLNSEQFALAMYLVNQAKNGTKPPTQLSPEMIPPSSRPKPTSDATNLDDLSLPGGAQLGGDTGLNKEMESISKEIDGFGKEKVQLQQDIRDKEEQVKTRMLEVESLQTELDSNQSQIRQLSNHKSDAERKLEELEEQKQKADGLLAEVQKQCQETKASLEALQQQIKHQQSAVDNQVEELNKAQKELEALRQEELASEQKKEASTNQLDMLQTNLKQTNDEIAKLQSKINLVREGQQKLNSSISQYDSAIETSKTTGELPTVEELPPLSLEELSIGKSDDALSSRATAGSSPVSSLSAYSISSEPISRIEEDDPFKGKDLFAEVVGTGDNGDPFKSVDPFKDADPFKSDDFIADPFGGDPFKSDDPFAREPASAPSDPFKGDDPFSGGLTNGQADVKPASNDLFASFDAFAGAGFGSSGGTFSKSSSTDNFGGDPFKTDDVPEIPPKKSKAPPTNTTSTPSSTSAISSDPFQAFGPKDASSPSTSDPFGSASSVKSPSDPFSFSGSAKSEEGNDPFSTPSVSKKDDPFASFSSSSKVSDGASDPFTVSASTTSDKSVDMFGAFGMTPGQSEKQDPFVKGSDPFGGSFVSNFDSTVSSKDSSKSDSTLDPFGEKKKQPSDDPFGGNNADPFGASAANSDDPFGGSTAKPDDPFGGSTAKPGDPFGGSTAKPDDPFGGSASKSGGFADFANFGNVKNESSSDNGVAWALQQSILEKEKQDQLARQEEEDLQKALSLSKADFTSSEA
ncbi:uncharacterized protein [Apostichopus japonicus]|uniref:uncharacterized protein isoform X2 n=1 Tax=Stichopus japonicus TaxID=307972 RepID=UPI003AB4B9F6